MIKTPRPLVHAFAVAGLSVALLGGCQTTNVGKTTEVDPSETDILLPPGLKNIKGFTIKKAEFYDEASYHRETIKFSGGEISYERYYRGGFHYIREKQLKDIIGRWFDSASDIQEIKYTRTNVGRTYYTTFKVDGGSCFFMGSSYGRELEFATGTGSEARTLGYYCEKGDVELEEPVMAWLKKVRLKD